MYQAATHEKTGISYTRLGNYYLLDFVLPIEEEKLVGFGIMT